MYWIWSTFFCRMLKHCCFFLHRCEARSERNRSFPDYQLRYFIGNRRIRSRYSPGKSFQSCIQFKDWFICIFSILIYHFIQVRFSMMTKLFKLKMLRWKVKNLKVASTSAIPQCGCPAGPKILGSKCSLWHVTATNFIYYVIFKILSLFLFWGEGAPNYLSRHHFDLFLLLANGVWNPM